jgi:hypothetical protein
VEGHGEAAEAPPAEVPQAVLQQRAGIMFSGATGASVASGEGVATSAPSPGLAKAVVTVIEGLDDALFDRNAEHRPCGLLCRYGAGGMLIGDVLGLPLMPWALAEPIGKAAAKIVKDTPVEVKKAKKKAKRKGGSAEEAAEAVLRRRVNLPLPTAAEIKAAWRQIAKAAQLDEAAALPAAPEAELTPTNPSPKPPEPHVRSAACCNDEEMCCPHARAVHDMATSPEASRTIIAAFVVLASSQGNCDPHFNEKLELAQVRYRHALRQLQQAYPGELCGFSQNSAKQMIDWVLRLESAGLPVPIARAAARKVGFDFERGVAHHRARTMQAKRDTADAACA